MVGQTIRLNGHSLALIGVAPKGFRGHAAGLKIDLFAPLGNLVPGFPKPETLRQRNSGALEVLGRLKPGRAIEAARLELSGLALGFVRETTPDAPPEVYTVRVEEWAPVPAIIRGGVQAFFAVLLLLVALVLGMASVNVANMILSRSVERRREISVRLAIGAGRGRILQQLVTESLVLYAAAGFCGVLLSSWATRLLMTFKPPLPPGFTVELDLGIDGTVLFFAVAVSVISGMIFTLLPALRASRTDLVRGLRDDSTGAPERSRMRSLMRSLMVGGQMTATLIVLICSGLFLRALQSLEQLDPGWNADGVQVSSFDLEMGGYDSERGRIFYRELMQ